VIAAAAAADDDDDDDDDDELSCVVECRSLMLSCGSSSGLLISWYSVVIRSLLTVILMLSVMLATILEHSLHDHNRFALNLNLKVVMLLMI